MNYSRKHIKHLAYRCFIYSNRESYEWWLNYIRKDFKECSEYRRYSCFKKTDENMEKKS